MATDATASPLADRFRAALEAALPIARATARLEEYGAAFDAAEPALATSPQRRIRLREAIDELAEAGILRPSTTADRSERPPLPTQVTLLARDADPPVGREAAAYPWRPELGWATGVPLRRSEFDALRQIQAHLRDRDDEALVVPVGERSLEVFGDEKRLAKLANNARLFGPGRLSLKLLRARAYAPPFVFRRVGPGPVVLVVENQATFYSVTATLPADTPVGLVVFGGGGSFGSSVGYLADLAADTGIDQPFTAIRYFGDLDRRGLEIPIAANAAAQAAGLPPVRPAVGLWQRLLLHGRRAPHAEVPPEVAERVTAWLPSSVRDAALEVLLAGERMAQEAVGTALLSRDRTWASWASLGPSGLPAYSMAVPAERALPVTGSDALVLTDAGVRIEPGPDEWDAWVSASRTRNFVRDDPLLDWLHLFGRDGGFVPDDERPGFDPRTDFRAFVLDKGQGFEAGVMRLLDEWIGTHPIGEDWQDARSPEKATETLQAMRRGEPLIAQAVLRNPDRRTYGMADLLIRSDVLARFFPEAISISEAAHGAPALGLADRHYRVIDVKFHGFDLLADGHLSGASDELAYGVQVWLYNEALGRMQGYLPPASYLLGRAWKHGDEHGEGCFERLARVDTARYLRSRDAEIGDVAAAAVEWVRRLRAEGVTWHVLPEPSVPELYPHARSGDDAPWHAAKADIARALCELTLLPGMNPGLRAAAHARGIRRWDEPGLTAAALGITSDTFAARCNAILAANQPGALAVVPERILNADPRWRERPPVEFYVDFETVSALDDDFSRLPAPGGQALIAQIGCGHVTSDGRWAFAQWTVDALAPDAERRIVEAWVTHMRTVAQAAGVDLALARVDHWSAAEPVNLETAYNSARSRHPDADWPPDLPWFDLLQEIVRAEPMAVAGGFNFGLKAIAKGMHAAGLILTSWGEGPTDGLGAMVGLWSAAHECAATGSPMSEHPLMREIAAYNEVDCRVMWEVLEWLRENR